VVCSVSSDIGTWLRQQLHDRYVVEETGWAPERVTRVAQRLQRDVGEEERLAVDVLWMDEHTAFTAPGRYIYFSRRLLELCRNDEMAAFVVAHELAHHRLGHTDIFPDWLVDLAGEQVGSFLAALYKNLSGRLYSPEREVAADLAGIDLCVSAGYEAMKCLEIFDIMEKVALDLGDVDMVFGPDESDQELDADAPVSKKLQIWIWQRLRGYLPIRDRRYQLLKHLGKLPAG
jgi:predicted Zn-dependent protease